MLSHAYLIAVFPVLSFVIITFLSRKLKSASAYVAIFAVGLSFLYSLGIFFRALGGAQIEVRVPWLDFGGLKFQMGYTVDSLTAVMLIVVTLVSLLVHIYSVGYMHGDPRYPRFFSYLSLFTTSMLILVLGNNLMMLYAGWELVGLSSYLLIGFWFEKPSAMRAAKKAFLVTRVGDVGFFLGILMLFAAAQTMDFHSLFASVEKIKSATYHFPFMGEISGETYLNIAMVFLFGGAVGKSAQFPLHVWLPDAMEGPTPVSALIHAATMVAAGIYMVARLFVLFHAAPVAMLVVSYTAAITAIMAATIAIVQNDIKRILAYSTVSQLGYMLFGIGVSENPSAGMFHLFTHAFFKALLFLGSGSVIHGTGTQDIMEMGGLYSKMKTTAITFLVGSVALAGIPPLAGFWSKDEILLEAFNFAQQHGGGIHWLIFAFGVAGAFLTAFYMTRCCWLTFFGENRAPEHAPTSDAHGTTSHDAHAQHDGGIHESPLVMTVPLIILAVLSVFVGFWGSPFLHHGFQTFLLHGMGMEEHAAEPNYILMGFSVLVALSGIFFGLVLYAAKIVSPAFFTRTLKPVYVLLKNKYFFDEIYMLIIIQPLLLTTRLMSAIDKYIVDGIVNLAGWTTLQFSLLQGLIDKYIVDGIVNLIGIVTRGIGRILRFTQTGLVQNYMFVAVIGILILTFLKLLSF